MEPFATDEFKDFFVIFRIDNGDELGAYVWVYENGMVKVTDIYGLASYCNHSVSPINVGEIPEDMVEMAYKRLSELDEEEKKELFSGFNERVEEGRKHDDSEKREYEAGVLKDIREGKNVNDGLYWFM